MNTLSGGLSAGNGGYPWGDTITNKPDPARSKHFPVPVLAEPRTSPSQGETGGEARESTPSQPSGSEVTDFRGGGLIWDEKAEHDRDLEWESSSDYHSWERE